MVWPAIVKLEHHDEKHFICTAKNEKHFHTAHENCYICSFEFSSFLTRSTAIDLEKQVFFANYLSSYKLAEYKQFPGYSFHFRAPPIFI
jgi:hypothetical protein